jgi:hypothetical protein
MVQEQVISPMSATKTLSELSGGCFTEQAYNAKIMPRHQRLQQGIQREFRIRSTPDVFQRKMDELKTEKLLMTQEEDDINVPTTDVNYEASRMEKRTKTRLQQPLGVDVLFLDANVIVILSKL